MRISIKDNWETTKGSRIWLNDEEVSTRCFAADDVEGWVDCYIHDEQGYVAREEGTKALKRERLYGSVRIVVNRPLPPSNITAVRDDSGGMLVNWERPER